MKLDNIALCIFNGCIHLIDYMKTLKCYVRNHNCPEGCIVESYFVEEALAFCAE